MNIEEQVLSIEQAKHLQKLGLDMSDAAMCWTEIVEDNGHSLFDLVRKEMLDKVDLLVDDYIPTYTLQEVLDKLPVAFRPNSNDRNMLLYDSIADGQIWYENYYGTKMIYKDGNTLLDAAYKLLCWLLDNGYLKEDKK